MDLYTMKNDAGRKAVFIGKHFTCIKTESAGYTENTSKRAR